MPPELDRLGLLQRLTLLDASSNLIGDLPPSITKLGSLTSLSLRHNKLQALPADIKVRESD